MTQEETLKRISKESEQYVSLLFGTLADGTWRINAKKDFIAGAKSERNKVLDEAIEELSKCEDREQRQGHSLSEYAFKDAIFILESLKVDL